ncbi:MarR family transcriptional regulator [Roseobacter sp. WL0113]|uniref:MarR family transcriptional regulator n=2 Tax=Roseobacter sinensis TaxID=2931391 RepID=A0ABT3BK31_9RHOB|nr:MarR family transcriptional regulator [Roseobacter sp. WL0113]
MLDDQVGYLLRLAGQRHAAIFQAHTVQGLTPTQFSTLVRLAENGPCSQNQLGRLAAMDIATIKGVVDRLRQRGFVRTAPSADDRRRHIVSLTDEGARALDRMIPAGRVITEETLAPLKPPERRNLIKLLRKLG